ncbi:unnamed protein product [Coregonus sp. 'balchen']|uniref:Uncharacterized protein n=1 Tax=Coregonus suidteri TaxID=861788 RepID=A0AAN8L557_9TELE|nr:unnamed protein product [Coregonus sp. 'balchen']
MAEEEPLGDTEQVLRRLKPKLIDTLSADPDFVLQHADSLSLLSRHEYKQVKALTNPSKQAQDLLDHVIHKGPTAAEKLLRLLRGKEMQETFPKLLFLKELPVNDQRAAGETGTGGNEVIRKRRQTVESEENLPAKQTCKDAGTKMVVEKDLMRVARRIGHSWREIGTGALDIPSVKLEQIQENYPHSHVDRVFAMLRYWSTLKRHEATAANLHSLLCQDDWALPPDSIDFLLDTI